MWLKVSGHLAEDDLQVCGTLHQYCWTLHTLADYVHRTLPYPHQTIGSPHCVLWFVMPHNFFHCSCSLHQARHCFVLTCVMCGIWAATWPWNPSFLTSYPTVVVAGVDPDTVWNSCVMVWIDACLSHYMTLFNCRQSLLVNRWGPVHIHAVCVPSTFHFIITSGTVDLGMFRSVKNSHTDTWQKWHPITWSHKKSILWRAPFCPSWSLMTTEFADMESLAVSVRTMHLMR